ncbi:MAG: hypothetical protein MUE73_02750 [Planctomycetes bacterium]|nr:hypothetical protein [Planctomycetota bacterium]
MPTTGRILRLVLLFLVIGIGAAATTAQTLGLAGTWTARDGGVQVHLVLALPGGG